MKFIAHITRRTSKLTRYINKEKEAMTKKIKILTEMITLCAVLYKEYITEYYTRKKARK